MTQIRVFSDQPILLQGFLQALGSQGFDLVACALPVAGNAWQAESLAGDSAPPIILLDVTAGLTFSTLSALHEQFPAAAVVLWADQLPLEVVFKTLEFGVRGIVTRTSGPEQLTDALRKVANGEMQIGFGNPREMQQPKRSANLTPREREIIGLLRQGLRNKQIALEMGITEGTVKIYLFRLFQKLGVRNRFDLARCGMLDQISSPPQQASSSASDPARTDDDADRKTAAKAPRFS